MIPETVLLRKLSNTDLFLRAKEDVKAETNATLRVLNTLREIERRRASAEKSYPSLFDFCVEFLGYKRGAAYRRILAMRALKDLPEVEEKIQSGSLTLMTLAQAQSYFKEQACEKKPLASAQKLEIIKELENKSCRDTETYFLKLSPKPKTKETLKTTDLDHYQWQVSLPRRVKDKIDRLRSLLGPDGNGLDKIEVIEKALDVTIKERTLNKRQNQGQPQTLKPVLALEQKHEPNISPSLGKSAGKNQRFIPIVLKRFVWQRDNSQCSFIDPLTGQRCREKMRLQIDHRVPIALGGGSDSDNLRLTCLAHNQFYAIQTLGLSKMNNFINPTPPK